MFKKKTKLKRQERRLIAKLKTWDIYKIISWGIYRLFSYNKRFLVSPKKTLAVISITVWSILWRRVWYIDDFIVDKKARGKWVWNKIFTEALDNIKAEKGEYVFLVSRNERKVSHIMYKKFGFVVVSLWVGVLAYKKLKTKKSRFSFLNTPNNK